VRGNSGEGAFRAGDDFVGAEAFENFGEFVEIATDDDMRFFVAVAGAFGDEESGFDVVGSDDEELGALNACIGEGGFLFGVVHDDGLAVADEIVHGGGIFINQNVRLLGAAKMLDDANAEMRIADNDGVILHFFGDHAATLLRIVALQSLEQENGDDDAEENALAPEGVENPERIGGVAKISGVEKRIGEWEMLKEVEGECAEREPEGDEDESPAALAEEDAEANPEKTAHGSWQRTIARESGEGHCEMFVGTRTPDLADPVGPL
jgi:hypothetical protein